MSFVIGIAVTVVVVLVINSYWMRRNIGGCGICRPSGSATGTTTYNAT